MDHRERTITGLTAMLRDHADDPVTGACPHCRRHYCAVFAEAKAELLFMGVRLDEAAERAA